MKKNRNTQAQFRPRPVVVACALLVGAGMAQAQNQAAPTDQQLDTVVVSGIRKGIEAAISMKKNSDLIIEAVSAEDIGKLPDIDIADSLARLPGVTAQRDQYGRATQISIRGMGPDFVGTTLNGREQTSTTDTRAVDYSSYPSELVNAAVVYKTPRRRPDRPGHRRHGGHPHHQPARHLAPPDCHQLPHRETR